MNFDRICLSYNISWTRITVDKRNFIMGLLSEYDIESGEGNTGIAKNNRNRNSVVNSLFRTFESPVAVKFCYIKNLRKPPYLTSHLTLTLLLLIYFWHSVNLSVRKFCFQLGSFPMLEAPITVSKP